MKIRNLRVALNWFHVTIPPYAINRKRSLLSDEIKFTVNDKRGALFIVGAANGRPLK